MDLLNYVFVVGTNVGDISLWEVGSRERLAHKPFKVWDLSAATMPLQVLLISTSLEALLALILTHLCFDQSLDTKTPPNPHSIIQSLVFFLPHPRVLVTWKINKPLLTAGLGI